jgi:hypothetical protein
MPLTPEAIAGEASFEGCLAIIDVDRQFLQARLPPSIALPERHSTICSCLLAFGAQSEGTTFFGGVPVSWGIGYHELMVAVPFVACHDAAGEHLFVTGMSCDFWPAVWNGNFYYGFHKQLAQMHWNGTSYSVTDGGPRSCFRAEVQRSGDSAAHEAFGWIRAAAALPVLGRRADGSFVVSRFDWDFRQALVEAASVQLTLGEAFQELPPGDHLLRHDETVWVRKMGWRLGWPVSADPR